MSPCDRGVNLLSHLRVAAIELKSKIRILTFGIDTVGTFGCTFVYSYRRRDFTVCTVGLSTCYRGVNLLYDKDGNYQFGPT